MPETTLLAQLAVKVDGSPLAVTLLDHLVDTRVEKSLALPDTCTLRVVDPDFGHLDAGPFAIGAALEVEMAGTETVTVFTGEVTALATEPAPNGEPELVVTALDRAHRLAHGVKVATFVEMAGSDVVSQIAGAYGLQADVTSTQPVLPFIQQRETDYAFLDRLALMHGCRWGVDGQKLWFKLYEEPEDGGVTLAWGEELESFRVRMTGADEGGSVEVRAWDSVGQRAIVGTNQSRASLSGGLASSATGATSVAAKARDFGKANNGKRFASWSVPDQGSASAVARRIGENVVSTQVSARGVARLRPGIAPGKTVAIEGVGTKLSGGYAVTSVLHVVSAGQRPTTRFSCESMEAADLVGLLRGPGEAALGRVTDLMVGVVTNIKDPEGLSRVKVNFPALSNDGESAWARLVQPGAGSQRGLHIMPEIDDEVLVGFEHGDTSRPLVLGGLWSSKKAAPNPTSTAVKQDKVAVRTLKTRAGHVIALTDAEGTGNKIEIMLAGDKGSIVIGDDKIVVKTPKDVEVTADGKIALKATGDLTLEGQNVKVTAQSNIDIQGAQVTTKGKAKLTSQAPQVEVKADAQLNLQAGAMVQVKGAMVSLG